VEATPQFLQGVYRYEGNGLEKPFLLDEELIYEVPSGLETQLVYFRAGNSSDELIYTVLMRDGEPMRCCCAYVDAQTMSHSRMHLTLDYLFRDHYYLRPLLLAHRLFAEVEFLFAYPQNMSYYYYYLYHFYR